MSNQRCKNCGKPPLAGRAGSFTSYFFEHNYCQCAARKPDARSHREKEEDDEVRPLCAVCGKSKPLDKRAGSFTSFLFKELRCECSDSAEVSPNSVAKRTQTAKRLAKKKQFTENIKAQNLTAVESMAEAIMPVDTIVGGIFRIVSLIGMGGMGVVYLVEQTSLQKLFALKVLTPELVNQQNWLRFKAEAKTMASLNHPTFVKVYDLGIHDGKIPFYAMDYLKGRSLEEILAVEGQLSLTAAIDIFLEVATGLAYAHRNDIVHRDIKPANIMLCSENATSTVKVLDFGISKLIGSEASKMQSLTLAGEVFGSPFYMSPEQCSGSNIDSRSDIYSIGCTLFEALTGYVPFEGNNSVDTMLMHRDEPAPLLSDVLPNKKFPLQLEAVLATCLAKDPNDRYQSTAELVKDLEQIKRGKNIDDSPALYQLDKLEDQIARRAMQRRENQDDASARPAADVAKTSLILATLLISAIAGTAFYLFKPATKVDKPKETSTEQKIDFALGDQILSPQRVADSKRLYYSKIINDGHNIEFTFPLEQSLGKIGLSENPRKLQKAQSTVTFPVGNAIYFYPNVTMFSTPEAFESFRDKDLFALAIPFELQESYQLSKAMPSIAKLTSIRVLNLQGGILGDEEIADLNKMTNLEVLNVSSTNISGDGMATFKRLKELRKLYCGFIHNHTKLLQALQGSNKIDTLGLNALEQPLSEADAKLIATCKNLSYLNLEASITSDKVLPILATLPKLAYIDFHGCTISKKAITDFAKACLPRRIRLTLPKVVANEKSILEVESPENWLSQ